MQRHRTNTVFLTPFTATGGLPEINVGNVSAALASESARMFVPWGIGSCVSWLYQTITPILYAFVHMQIGSGPLGLLSILLFPNLFDYDPVLPPSILPETLRLIKNFADRLATANKTERSRGPL